MHYWINVGDYNPSELCKGKVTVRCVKTACGAVYAGEINHTTSLLFSVKCKECKNTDIYKQDLIAFEIGFESNLNEWLKYCRQRYKE